MRGVHSVVDELRKSVFEEVARLAYEGGDYKRIDEIPYKIVPGEVAHYRNDVFLERAIVTERLRMACGLPFRNAGERTLPSDGIEEAAKPEKYYEPPLINIIPFACNACPEKEVRISSNCQGCLSRPCRNVCPKEAIYIDRHGHSCVDQSKCIKCGRCKNQCPYDAISIIERPCAKSCGMGAICSDELGHAKIDYDKCTSCGSCLVNCPFGAIADKSQIFQLIQEIKTGEDVIAIVAPSIVGQFGPAADGRKLQKALRMLGFADVVEVAVGADICAVEEAEDFVEHVPTKQPFMATSCCPSWSVMVKKLFPEYANNISLTMTPMVLTARLVKKDRPNAKIVFIGPCVAKKNEASRKSVRSDVDFVITYEELQGMFAAKEIVPAKVIPDECDKGFTESTAAGYGFAVSGGVASAVADVLNKTHPDIEVKYESATGLKDCRKLLLAAQAGKKDGFLLEGMACSGGCVAGAGTICPVPKATALNQLEQNKMSAKSALESSYLDRSEELT